MLELDASAALAWIFERTDVAESALANRLLDSLAEQPVLVPVLWHTEVANALLVAERRGVVREAQVIDYLNRLIQLPIITEDVAVPTRQGLVMALGREHGQERTVRACQPDVLGTRVRVRGPRRRRRAPVAPCTFCPSWIDSARQCAPST